MTEKSNNFYQYDSCITRGICSINPKTSSLLEIIVMYLKLGAYYAQKMITEGKENLRIRSLILNTISVLVSYPELSENNFTMITNSYKEELPKIIKEYANISKKEDVKPDFLNTEFDFNKPYSIIESIRLGEKEFLNKIKSTPTKTLDMFKILFVLTQSICTNTIYIESYEENADIGYKTILKILNTLQENHLDEQVIKDLLTDSAKTNILLMEQLKNIHIKKYGTQKEKKVSYSTEIGKAVLVVGSNLQELEHICDSLQEEDIDIYTHDDMILAHTFPHFSNYKHLKGQFGQGEDNCLLDFSTFPGPIILTKHSLYNVENLYRGLLFTTDFAYSKGVIPIKNQDLTPVINSAKGSKGFKTGKICDFEKVGYCLKKVKNTLKEKLENNKFKKIIILGILGFSTQEKEYYEKMLKIIPDDYLVISVPCVTTKENIISLNTSSDSYAILQIIECLNELTDLPISIFFPKCDKHTISQIIFLSTKNKYKIFLGKCTPHLLNPSIIKTLNKIFNINEFTTPKKDLSKTL